MANNKPSVTSAAPWANLANKRSAKLAVNHLVRCVEAVHGRRSSAAAGLLNSLKIGMRTRVYSLYKQLDLPERTRAGQDVTAKLADYFQDNGLPALSLIPAQDLNTCVLTESGIGT